MVKADQTTLTGLFAFDVVASLETRGKMFTLKEQFKVFFANEIPKPIAILETIEDEKIEPDLIYVQEQTKIEDTIPVVS